MTQNVKYIRHIRLRSIFLVVILLISDSSIAQGQMDNWFFGKWAGLNFSSGIPQAIAGSALNSIEACASISDRDGNLLFYSQASRVFNRAHEKMKNGDLNSDGDNATQGTGIVPMPGASDKYYVFSMRFSSSDYCALKYAIVDMSRDNNRGEVIEKDHLLRDKLTEKLTFVRQTDSHNFWIIAHDYNSDEYSVFLLSDSGFSDASTYATSLTQKGRYGYLQPSPDGSMLAAAVKYDGFIEVSCFDPMEGIISSSFKLEIPGVPYGVCFSPDNSKLYVTSGSPNHLYQFDLTQEKSNLIQDSRVQISSTPIDDYPGATGALQLAPNGKIYLSPYDATSLAAINQPNALGTDCAYVENAVSLGDIGRSEHGLPNTGNLFLDQTPANILSCTESNESNQQFGCEDLLVTPNPTNGYILVKSLGDEISSIIVYDITGRLVVPKTSFNSFEAQLDEMQFLGAGTYIVRVSHGRCLNEKKIIVMH